MAKKVISESPALGVSIAVLLFTGLLSAIYYLLLLLPCCCFLLLAIFLYIIIYHVIVILSPLFRIWEIFLAYKKKIPNFAINKLGSRGAGDKGFFFSFFYDKVEIRKTLQGWCSCSRISLINGRSYNPTLAYWDALFSGYKLSSLLGALLHLCANTSFPGHYRRKGSCGNPRALPWQLPLLPCLVT